MPKAPAVIRTKLVRPDALGIFSGGRPDSVMEMSGMKKQAIAAPCRMVGTISVAMSTCVLKCARMHADEREHQERERRDLARVRLGSARPTIGDSMMARNPTGASTKPASVAV